MIFIYETDVEAVALTWSEALGYQTLHGPDIVPLKRSRSWRPAR